MKEEEEEIYFYYHFPFLSFFFLCISSFFLPSCIYIIQFQSLHHSFSHFLTCFLSLFQLFSLSLNYTFIHSFSLSLSITHSFILLITHSHTHLQSPQVWCRSRVSLPPTAAHTLAAHLAAAQGWGCTW